LAHTWHSANGFPPAVDRAFAQSDLGALEFLVGIPEYKVALPGGDTASQTDLFVLARDQHGETIALGVDGKALEPFGDNVVSDWRLGRSDISRENRRQRLAFLLRVLGLRDDEHLGRQRYQLLHRTASPLIEAERLHATHAVMLVHSFGGENKWFDEFASFAALLEAEVSVGSIVQARRSPRSLYLGWVSDAHPDVS